MLGRSPIQISRTCSNVRETQEGALTGKKELLLFVFFTFHNVQLKKNIL